MRNVKLAYHPAVIRIMKGSLCCSYGFARSAKTTQQHLILFIIRTADHPAKLRHKDLPSDSTKEK